MTSPYRDPLREEDLAQEIVEESDEEFDRVAFAHRALDLVDPKHTRVLVCEGARKLRVDTGRAWGRRYGRWAIFWVPRRASRRAIALAALELASGESTPFALDVLLAES